MIGSSAMRWHGAFFDKPLEFVDGYSDSAFFCATTCAHEPKSALCYESPHRGWVQMQISSDPVDVEKFHKNVLSRQKEYNPAQVAVQQLQGIARMQRTQKLRARFLQKIDLGAKNRTKLTNRRLIRIALRGGRQRLGPGRPKNSPPDEAWLKLLDYVNRVHKKCGHSLPTQIKFIISRKGSYSHGQALKMLVALSRLRLGLSAEDVALFTPFLRGITFGEYNRFAKTLSCSDHDRVLGYLGTILIPIESLQNLRNTGLEIGTGMSWLGLGILAQLTRSIHQSLVGHVSHTHSEKDAYPSTSVRA